MRVSRTSTVAVALAALHCGSTTIDAQSDGRSDASTDADAAITTDSGAADASLDAAPCATAARVQFAFGSDDAGAADSISVTLPNATRAGDFIVVGIDYFDCASITAITDTAGNTYKSLASVSGNGQAGDLETWGATSLAPTTNDAVTVHFTTACNSRNVKVVEYAGVDSLAPVVETATQFGEGGAPDASLTTAATAIVFGHTADSEMSLGPGSGFTQIFIDDWSTIAEEKFVGAGSYRVSEQTASGEHWGIQAVALRACK
jgi:hypothetical protein